MSILTTIVRCAFPLAAVFAVGWFLVIMVSFASRRHCRKSRLAHARRESFIINN
jgi:Mg2+/citrate symporter